MPGLNSSGHAQMQGNSVASWLDNACHICHDGTIWLGKEPAEDRQDWRA
ncbi:hypothetical protein EKH55_0668 [Sinorhizobium alkalisoli]|nr:hypothetical protein EKH55_0668 [Sinorhizobium alkalisoli]